MTTLALPTGHTLPDFLGDSVPFALAALDVLHRDGYAPAFFIASAREALAALDDPDEVRTSLSLIVGWMRDNGTLADAEDAMGKRLSRALAIVAHGAGTFAAIVADPDGCGWTAEDIADYVNEPSGLVPAFPRDFLAMVDALDDAEQDGEHLSALLARDEAADKAADHLARVRAVPVSSGDEHAPSAVPPMRGAATSHAPDLSRYRLSYRGQGRRVGVPLSRHGP